MPRRPHPWYHSERDWWYVTIDGQRTRLEVRGEGNAALAHDAWHQLLQAAQHLQQLGGPPPGAPPVATAGGSGRTVRELVADYLAAPGLGHGAATRQRVRWSLGHFVTALGDVPLARLTARQVETALPETLSSSARHGAIGDFLVCLAWGGVSVGRVRRPPKESRGADAVLTPTQYEVVKALATGDLRPMVEVLWETGCRPGEAAALTTENVDWSNGIARLKGHKTRRHTGRDRVIVLPPAALAALARQRDRHQSGHLFRTTAGKPFGVQRINQRFQDLARRAGFRVFAYSFRHSYITRALEAGMSDSQVAALVGHNSTAMLHKFYSHLGENTRLLKSLADSLSAGTYQPPRSA